MSCTLRLLVGFKVDYSIKNDEKTSEEHEIGRLHCAITKKKQVHFNVGKSGVKKNKTFYSPFTNQKPALIY